MKYLFVAGLLLLFSQACNQSGEAPPAPKTPKETVLSWQHYLDNNQFDQARELGTENAREFLHFLEGFFQGENESLLITNTELLDLDCLESGSHAICTYRVIEQGEEISDAYHLVKVNGKWLVDIPQEDDFLSDPALDSLSRKANEFFDTLGRDN